MKITAIETYVCHARVRNWVFVKVVTDQPGLYGWGETTLEWHTRGVVGAIEDLASLVVGEDPTCGWRLVTIGYGLTNNEATSNCSTTLFVQRGYRDRS